MEYQLELIDVAKQYKDFLAVDRVNMQIKKGDRIFSWSQRMRKDHDSQDDSRTDRTDQRDNKDRGQSNEWNPSL